MKYIDSEKLLAEIDSIWKHYLDRDEYDNGFNDALDKVKDFINSLQVKDFIDSLQQEQPKGNLEYWLEHFGMPKENIDNCITQIAQGYGACRYLEGIQHGAEAVNEIAKQEQPEVDFEKFTEKIKTFQGRYKHPEIVSIKGAMAFMARMFYQYPNVARQWYEQLPKATMD